MPDAGIIGDVLSDLDRDEFVETCEDMDGKVLDIEEVGMKGCHIEDIAIMEDGSLQKVK